MLASKSDFTEMSFMETEIKNIELNDVDFYRGEIIKTNLRDVDFSSCKINNIIVDSFSLEGIIIDRFQAQDLVGMLGVKFKD